MMKKCPFCAEQIRDEALKCRFCGEFLKKPETGEPWYFRTSFFIIALFCIGPFALPLVWFNPRYSRVWKWAITFIVSIATYFLTLITIESVKNLKAYYDEIFQLLNG